MYLLLLHQKKTSFIQQFQKFIQLRCIILPSKFRFLIYNQITDCLSSPSNVISQVIRYRFFFKERDRLKPPPPPKPLGLAPAHNSYRPDIALAPEVYNHLRGLQKKAKDLRMEMRTLRRLSQAQAVAVREDIKDAFMGIRATLLASTGTYWGQGDQEKTRLSREEEMYKQEVIRLEKDLSDLESSVEGLRGEVINRRTRVNMTAVEDMALVLSRAR